MIVLGITGSIGMGKSTASRLLERLGVPVHDSDAAAHALLRPGAPAFEEVALTFPEAWDKKKHIIRRDILREIVFNDAHKREGLERILHPHIRRGQVDFLRKCKRMGAPIAALDIPLLFETGAQDRVDYALVVSAPFHHQRRRVLSRPGMEEGQFEKILSSQMPDSEKRARADFIVQTGMGIGYTFRQLKHILQTIKS